MMCWQIFLAKIAELSYQESLRVIDQIIESLSPNIRKKNVQIKEILYIKISHSITVRFQTCLNLIKHLADEIETLGG
jgi:hypothetical protein